MTRMFPELLPPEPPSLFTEELANKAVALLSECASPDEVATLMRERQVTGRRLAVHSCPVANLVAQESHAACVIVSPYSIVVYGWRDSVRRSCMFDTPAQVRGFIGQFDRQRYPDLETPDQ